MNSVYISQHKQGRLIDSGSFPKVILQMRAKGISKSLTHSANLILGNEDCWPCHWTMQSMSITDAGKLVTCAVDLDARYVAGNINESSLRELWNGTLKRLRSFHKEKRFSEQPDICRSFRDWQSARAYYFGHNS